MSGVIMMLSKTRKICTRENLSFEPQFPVTSRCPFKSKGPKEYLSFWFPMQHLTKKLSNKCRSDTTDVDTNAQLDTVQVFPKHGKHTQERDQAETKTGSLGKRLTDEGGRRTGGEDKGGRRLNTQWRDN